MTVLTTICEYFSPIALALESKEQLEAFLLDMGVEIEFNETQRDAVMNILGVVSNLEDLESILQSMTEERVDVGSATEQVYLIVDSLRSAIMSLADVSAADLLELPSPINTKSWWLGFAEQIPGYLLIQWLRVNNRVMYELLHFVNVVTERRLPSRAVPIRGIDWQNLAVFVKDPIASVKQHYGWGSDFNHSLFIQKATRLVSSLGIPALNSKIDPSILREYYECSVNRRELSFGLFTGMSDACLSHPRLSLSPIPSSDGVGLLLNASLDGPASKELLLSDDWRMDLTAVHGLLDEGLGLEVHPDSLKLKAALPDKEAALVLKGEPEEPWLLLGNPDGMRLELAGVEASFGIAERNGKPEIDIGAKTTGDGLKLVINPADGDSFISNILGDKEMAITADLGLSYNSTTGLQFQGAGGFEVIVPLNKSIGPIQLDQLRLAMSAGNTGAQVEAAISCSADVSVVVATVDDVGLRGKLVVLPEGDNSGLLGPVDLVLEFKAPNGMGLAIDAEGLITGGGYLEHDESKFQYAGVAEIGFTTFSLSAIGILNTKMPDGSKGWSLFLSVFSEFPPIQLGFGFTLNGIGGIIGINRTMDVEALRSRLVSGAMDSIMFPEDPVANAPKIIRDIEAIFPPAQKQFIFAAMMNIAWGTPTLLSAELGVLIELPDPLRISLLGSVSATLPSPRVEILELHMDVFGLADFSAKTLSLDAVLRDSSIIKLLTLSGDMAMRTDFSDQPNMLLSIGGFSPRFNPPAKFPTLRRLKASLPLGGMAAVDLQSYVAFTSNTFQIGGRVDVWAKFVGFTAEGHLQYDALIQFSPFQFQFGLDFGVSVRAGSVTLMGVNVKGNMRGPSPWDIKGYAEFEILKIKKKINLDITVGKKKSNPPEHIPVAELLVNALQSPSSWTMVENDDCSKFVRLRQRGENEEPACHPAAAAQVNQNIVPLDTKIEVFGGGVVDGTDCFEVESVTLGSMKRAPTSNEFVKDWFAPANFFKMKQNEKIKAPSFEKMKSGVQFGFDGVEAGDSESVVVSYDETVIDSRLGRQQKDKTSLRAKLLTKLTKANPNAKFRAANSRVAGKRKLSKLQVQERKYAVLDSYTGEKLSVKGLTGKTYAETAAAARRITRGGAKYEIVPVEELGG